MSLIRVLFTGGFDPVHSGHLAAMQDCAKLGALTVAPNSDAWLRNKKGAAFQPLKERATILSHIKYVNEILTDWDDSDGTACNAIIKFHKTYSLANNILLFANGGDRTPETVSSKELDLCFDLGIMPIFNVGGGKTQSSSAFLQEWSKRV